MPWCGVANMHSPARDGAMTYIRRRFARPDSQIAMKARGGPYSSVEPLRICA
jgi:hypothetical protein